MLVLGSYGYDHDLMLRSKTCVVSSLELMAYWVHMIYVVICLEDILCDVASHGQQAIQVSFRNELPLEWFTLACHYMTSGNTYDHKFKTILMSMIWYRINENALYGPCRENKYEHKDRGRIWIAHACHQVNSNW